MSRRIAVRGIIVHNNKLLCFKLKDRDGNVSDFWSVPGGGLEEHESLKDGVERELLEETGIKPIVGELLFVQQFSRNDPPHTEELEFFFHIKNPGDYLSIDLSKTTHGVQEVDEVKFINPSENYVLPKFLADEPLDFNNDQIAKVFNYL